MRDPRNGSSSGLHRSRSRTRSPPPSLSRPRIHLHSLQGEERERDVTWRNPGISSYYRSSSPVGTPDRRDYRFTGPTSLRRDYRRGDYYCDKGDAVGSVGLKTLDSPLGTEKRHREGTERGRSETGPFRVREGYGCEEKGPSRSRYWYHQNGGVGSALSRVELGTGSGSASGEGVGLSGYFDPLVERSWRDYGRGSGVNDGRDYGGDYGSTPGLRTSRGGGHYVASPGLRTSFGGGGDYLASPGLRTSRGGGGGEYIASPNLRTNPGGGGGGGDYVDSPGLRTSHDGGGDYVAPPSSRTSRSIGGGSDYVASPSLRTSRGGAGDYVASPSLRANHGGGGGGYVASPGLRTSNCGGGDYVVLPSLRASLVDPIIGRCAGGGVIRGGVGSVFQDGMTERRDSEDYGVSRERYADVGVNTLLMKGRQEGGDEAYLKHKMSLDGGQQKLAEEEFSYRSGASGDGVHGDGVLRLREPYERLYVSEGRTQGFKEEELGEIGEPSKILMERKHSLERETGGLNQNSDWNAFEGIDDSVALVDENLQPLKIVDNLDSRDYSVGRTQKVIDMMGDNDGGVHSNNSLSPVYLQVSEKNHSIKGRKHVKKDKKKGFGVAKNVKQRLGPVRNVKQRLGPIGNVKQRLGPVPSALKTHKIAQKFSRKLPWVANYERRKFVDDVAKNMDDVDGSNGVQEVESSEVEEDKLDKVKTEPPEGSDDFAQMVQSAFLKFSKLLNEKSAYRKKYLEQGGSGFLRCSVCGSFSEFSSTLSLAQHAFASCKVGYRSEHLGFHKALCVLMGWKYAEGPTGSWSREILPASEAGLMKEDLIIWPPVVLVHNSSIVKGSIDDRIVVSIEQLKIVLKDMGFGQGITNVCRGKAANLSVMVVSFCGTLSGLQEAEGLHRFYAGKQHGRAEFEQICSNSCGSSGESQRISPDNVENVLYGYLGTASDMDVLDFETKKRSVVKSKKDIEASADTSLVSG